MKGKRILFVLPAMPNPPRSQGVSIRYYPLIEKMKRQNTIDTFVFSNNEVANKDVLGAQEMSNRFGHYVRKRKKVSLLKKVYVRLKSLLPQFPLKFILYDQSDLKHAILDFVAEHHYDLVVWSNSIYSSVFFDSINNIKTKTVWYDVVDSPTLLETTGKMRKALRLDFYVIYQLRLWEKKIAQSVDLVSYISRADSQIVSSQLPDNSNIETIPNGIWLSDYSKESITLDGKFTLGYLGNMTYKPNRDAVVSLFSDIFLPLKKQGHDLSLLLIGRDPDKELLSMVENHKSVKFTGSVNTIWPYVNAVDVFVLPLSSGAGMQNKVIEVMYAGKPVICTHLANAGIGAQHNEHLFLFEKNEQAINFVKELIINKKLRGDIGASARNYVEKSFQWEEIYKSLEKRLSSVH